MPTARPRVWALVLGLAWIAPPARAGDPVTATAEVDATTRRAPVRLSKRKHLRWNARWAPEPNQVEFGLFGGLLVVPRAHELFRPRIERSEQGFLSLRRVAPNLGARIGYFPLRALGVEAEGAFIPTATKATDQAARLFGARAHLVAQFPYSVTPFAVVGAGLLGIASPASVLGRDVDPALHIGIGVKAFFTRRLHARLDVRDTITPRRGVGGGIANWFDATLGVGVTLGRERDRAEPDVAPPRPERAPPPPDLDEVDLDTDDDGFPDDKDRCPTDAGIEPDGCPDLDPDHDGVLSSTDACPDEPETHNGFEDSDGCPDQVPEEVTKFEGTLQGVVFGLDSAELGAGSEKTLDGAVTMLQKFVDIRVEVSGHTDATGAREHNMTLSEQRAEAVARYLAEHGIDADRVQTRGAGPDEPVDSNATRRGRANNRRIEFRVLP